MAPAFTGTAIGQWTARHPVQWPPTLLIGMRGWVTAAGARTARLANLWAVVRCANHRVDTAKELATTGRGMFCDLSGRGRSHPLQSRCWPVSPSGKNRAFGSGIYLALCRGMQEYTRRRKDEESVKRWDYKRTGHPLKDPLEHYKQPLLTKTRGRAVIEFDSIDVHAIRREFGQNRRQFAHMIGVSRHTLRNWETGRRRPHGPARALLRALDTDPLTLARALTMERKQPLTDELEFWTP